MGQVVTVEKTAGHGGENQILPLEENHGRIRTLPGCGDAAVRLLVELIQIAVVDGVTDVIA